MSIRRSEEEMENLPWKEKPIGLIARDSGIPHHTLRYWARKLFGKNTRNVLWPRGKSYKLVPKVDWAKPDSEIALELNWRVAHVAIWRARRLWDWNQTDAELGRLHSVSRETVGKYRHVLFGDKKAA
jgi:hypothetical protein